MINSKTLFYAGFLLLSMSKIGWADDRPEFVDPLPRKLSTHWPLELNPPFANRCLQGRDDPVNYVENDFGRFVVAGVTHCHFKKNDPEGVWPYHCPAGYLFKPEITEYKQWFVSTWNDIRFKCQRSVICPVGAYASVASNGCRQDFIENENEEKPENGLSCPATGNPINTATGNKFQEELDYKVGVLRLRRYFNSRNYEDLGLGVGWSHEYQSRIIPAVYRLPRPINTLSLASPPDSAAAQLADTIPGALPVGFQVAPSPNYFLLARADGKTLSFDLEGKFNDAAFGAKYQVRVEPTGFTVTEGTTVEMYGADGRLQKIVRANEGVISLTYRPDGLLRSVSDEYGHKFEFSYDINQRITLVNTNKSHDIRYQYDERGRLKKVIFPGNENREYHYEDAKPYFLTGISDEAGVRYATWRYDGEGRAVSSEHGNGVDKYTLSFSQNEEARIVAEVDPLGTVRRYFFTKSGGRWLLTGKDQPGGAGCDPASSALGYDPNGNIKTRTDFNGVTTSYVYDLSRNLETSRTEAVGTPQARTIGTIWHPTFRLPATITEPGRVTEFTYDNTKGLLTQKKVTADGVSRIESWRYFPNGLVQTATDARGKVTSYTYDAQGNLATVTDPAGLQTRFTQYDAHGNVLTQVAPNGVTTTFTYDLRQRLKTRTTGGELTQFDYTPNGLMYKVTFPDQSWLFYRYDPAYRLVGIDHSNGSRVDYTLDNAGNTKREDRYDPAGVLATAQQAATQAQSVTTAPKAQ